MTEQSIQLGGTTIIPKYSIPSEITVLCITGLSGIISGDIDIGRTSGSNEYFNTQIIDDTNEIQKTVIGNLSCKISFSLDLPYSNVVVSTSNILLLKLILKRILS